MLRPPEDERVDLPEWREAERDLLVLLLLWRCCSLAGLAWMVAGGTAWRVVDRPRPPGIPPCRDTILQQGVSLRYCCSILSSLRCRVSPTATKQTDCNAVDTRNRVAASHVLTGCGGTAVALRQVRTAVTNICVCLLPPYRHPHP